LQLPSGPQRSLSAIARTKGAYPTKANFPRDRAWARRLISAIAEEPMTTAGQSVERAKQVFSKQASQTLHVEVPERPPHIVCEQTPDPLLID
jgi:hypothetical protein